jgi:hypothetical protein
VAVDSAPTRGRVPVPSRLAAIDRWIFADGDPRRYLVVRRALAALLLVRIATWRYHSYAGLPDELVHHVWYWRWTDGMPHLGAMVALQVLGVLAALGVLVGRRPAACFAVAWGCFLALAGLRAGVGKVLHNDAMALVAMVPFLVPGPARADDPGAAGRSGWPLRAAQLVVVLIYFTTGVQKLVHSGVEWVTSDNMRWIMEGGAAGARLLPAVPEWIASEPLLWRSAAVALLGLELAFPLVLVHRWARRVLLAGVVTMHLLTLVTLELDYLSWIAVDLALFIDWVALGERRHYIGASARSRRAVA